MKGNRRKKKPDGKTSCNFSSCHRGYSKAGERGAHKKKKKSQRGRKKKENSPLLNCSLSKCRQFILSVFKYSNIHKSLRFKFGSNRVTGRRPLSPTSPFLTCSRRSEQWRLQNSRVSVTMCSFFAPNCQSFLPLFVFIVRAGESKTSAGY